MARMRGSGPERRRAVRRAPGGTAPPTPAPVGEWSRPAPICEYRLTGPAGALLHVERKVRDRPGFVLALGHWLEEQGLWLEEFVYSPCPGGLADVEVVASGTPGDVVRSLQCACSRESVFETAHPDASVPDRRHTARCALYIPDGLLTHNILVPLGGAAFQPGAEDCTGRPYANISYLMVERSPYALGVPGYAADMYLTADSREVLEAALRKLDDVREPLGAADNWIFRTWPCACPACAGAAPP